MERIFQCSLEKCYETHSNQFLRKRVQNVLITQTRFQAFTWKNVAKRDSFLFLGKRHEKLTLYESVSHHFTFTELYFKAKMHSFDRYRLFTI